VEKYDKKNGSYKSCINPECDYLHSVDEAVAAEAAGEFALANKADREAKKSQS
jgi:DNA topoisomerase-1